MTRIRKTAGRVVFVGAGPGDPGLLTRRAHDALVIADHIVHDRRVRDALLAAGVDPGTPVAVTGEGTGDTQYTTSSSVDNMVTAVIAFTGRVVLSLGASVTERDNLGWWENRPLYGWKVLVPRTKEQ